MCRGFRRCHATCKKKSPYFSYSGTSPSPVPSSTNSPVASPLTSPTSSSSTSDCGNGKDFLHCNPETVAANRNLHFPDTMPLASDCDEVTMASTKESSLADIALVGRASSTPSKHLSEGQLGIFSVDLAVMRWVTGSVD